MAKMKKIFIMAALAALAGCSTPTPENRCCERCRGLAFTAEASACLKRMVNDLEIRNARVEAENDILKNRLATECKTADLVELERENAELHLRLELERKGE